MPGKLSADERARLAEANEAYRQNDYEHAHAILSVLSMAHPHDATVQYGLVKCLVKRGEPELAQTVCARFLDRHEDAKIRDAYRSLGGQDTPATAAVPATRWRPLALAAGVAVVLALAAWGVMQMLAAPESAPPHDAIATAAVAVRAPVQTVLETPAAAAADLPEPQRDDVAAPPPSVAPAANAPPARSQETARPLRTSRGNPPPFTKEVKWTDREFTAWTTSWGEYLEYRPRNARTAPQVIVIAHGSTQDDDEALHWARSYIERARWMAVAERTGNIIVSPVFDRTRYRGYRSLEGNPAGADRFVLAIVDSYSEYERGFFLYGHSAGGQFAHRFALTHPHRIERVVISASGNYAFPDREVDWPFGMRGAPNADTWLTATRLPLTIVVGARDTNPDGMGGRRQFGENRIERAQQWVAQMRGFAAHYGNPNCNFEVVVVPDAGHASAGIVNTSAQRLLPPGRYEATRRE